MQWLSDNWMMLMLIGTSVVTASSLLLHAIAPLTENTTDDRVAKFVDAVKGVLEKLAFNKANP